MRAAFWDEPLDVLLILIGGISVGDSWEVILGRNSVSLLGCLLHSLNSQAIIIHCNVSVDRPCSIHMLLLGENLTIKWALETINSNITCG